MDLQESGEMYLETILLLSKKKGSVRSVDVSEFMGYSKPSVSRAVGLLKNGGMITVDRDGCLRLTEEGLEIASRTYERHVWLSEFLAGIGVYPEVAIEDACRLEHYISAESFSALKRYAENRTKE